MDKVKRYAAQLISDAEERVDKRLKAMEEKVNRMEEFYLRAGSRQLQQTRMIEKEAKTIIRRKTPPTPIMKRSNAMIMPCPSITSPDSSIPTPTPSPLSLSSTIPSSLNDSGVMTAANGTSTSRPTLTDIDCANGLCSLKDDIEDCDCCCPFDCPVHKK